MDTHSWEAGKRPILVVGRRKDLPLPGAALTKEEQVEVAWEQLEDWKQSTREEDEAGY